MLSFPEASGRYNRAEKSGCWNKYVKLSALGLVGLGLAVILARRDDAESAGNPLTPQPISTCYDSKLTEMPVESPDPNDSDDELINAEKVTGRNGETIYKCDFDSGPYSPSTVVVSEQNGDRTWLKSPEENGLFKGRGVDWGEVYAAFPNTFTIDSSAGEQKSADQKLVETESKTAPTPARAETVPAQEFKRTAENALQDSELVLGPAEKGFDTAAFLANNADSLTSPLLTSPGAAAIIDQVAIQHSLGRRMLIALVESQPGGSGQRFFIRISQMAAWLSDGYYGQKYRDEPTPVNSGSTAHRALAYYLNINTPVESLLGSLELFAQTYERLFGPALVIAPPIPDKLEQPMLLLPFTEGETWHYTGGPHGAWGVATALGAVDLAPPSMVGCRSGGAPEWTVAAAPGTVEYSDQGLVLQDLDSDGDLTTGWVLAYLHMATEGIVPSDIKLKTGDKIGHPSCEGGIADGAHVHFARRFNGEWLPAAGGLAPLNLSGWTFTSFGSEYDGAMSHPEHGERMAVTSRRGGNSALSSDNGPPQREIVNAAWEAFYKDAPQLAGWTPGGSLETPEAPVFPTALNVPTPAAERQPFTSNAEALRADFCQEGLPSIYIDITLRQQLLESVIDKDNHVVPINTTILAVVGLSGAPIKFLIIRQSNSEVCRYLPADLITEVELLDIRKVSSHFPPVEKSCNMKLYAITKMELEKP